MKKEQKVLSYNNLPARLPITQTIFFTFIMNYYNAREWMWTVFIIISLVIWIACINKMAKQKEIEL